MTAIQYIFFTEEINATTHRLWRINGSDWANQKTKYRDITVGHHYLASYSIDADSSYIYYATNGTRGDEIQVFKIGISSMEVSTSVTLTDCGQLQILKQDGDYIYISCANPHGLLVRLDKSNLGNETKLDLYTDGYYMLYPYVFILHDGTIAVGGSRRGVVNNYATQIILINKSTFAISAEYLLDFEYNSMGVSSLVDDDNYFYYTMDYDSRCLKIAKSNPEALYDTLTFPDEPELVEREWIIENGYIIGGWYDDWYGIRPTLVVIDAATFEIVQTWTEPDPNNNYSYFFNAKNGVVYQHLWIGPNWESPYGLAKLTYSVQDGFQEVGSEWIYPSPIGRHESLAVCIVDTEGDDTDYGIIIGDKFINYDQVIDFDATHDCDIAPHKFINNPPNLGDTEVTIGSEFLLNGGMETVEKSIYAQWWYGSNYLAGNAHSGVYCLYNSSYFSAYYWFPYPIQYKDLHYASIWWKCPAGGNIGYSWYYITDRYQEYIIMATSTNVPRPNWENHSNHFTHNGGWVDEQWILGISISATATSSIDDVSLEVTHGANAVWSKKKERITYVLRLSATDLEAFRTMKSAHAKVLLSDNTYGLDDEYVWIEDIKSEYAHDEDWAHPWKVTIKLVRA